MSANGFLRDDELTVVQGSGANAIRLSLGFAAVLRRMQTDAAKDGVRVTLVASYHGAAGYRSRATQLDMRVHPSLYSITPGIVPGLPSEHGTGNCGDIDQGLAWVKKNGARYGVTFPLAFDHNHARWDGTTLAGESGAPIEAEKALDLGEEMKLITHPNGQPAMTDGAFVFLQIAASTMTELVPIYGAPIPVSAEAWQFTTDRVAEHVAWMNSLKSTASSVTVQPILAGLTGTVTLTPTK